MAAPTNLPRSKSFSPAAPSYPYELEVGGCVLVISHQYLTFYFLCNFRLDRLLVLLDSGGSTAIREAAARQIAQFAAKNVSKDAAGGDTILQDGSSLPSTSTAAWQGTSSEWNDVMTVVGKVSCNEPLRFIH